MIIKKSVPFKVLPLAIAVSLAGCGDDNLNPDALNAPETYEFESKIQPGLSTVNYREATTRLMLIRELNHLIKSDYLQAYGENNTHEDVVNLLNRYYTIGTKANDQSLTSNNVYDEYDPEGIELSGPTPLKSIELGENQLLTQSDFSDLEPNINLQDKIIGLNTPLPLRNENDNTFGKFFGWRNYHTSDGDPIPDRLVAEWFEIIATLATDGDLETKTISSNIDYATLLNSFLLTSVTYAEVMNNILVTNKLNVDNTATEEKPQSDLAKQWDLAFGYFGAARQLDTYFLSVPDSSSINLYENYNFELPKMSIYFDERSPLSDITYTKDILGNLIEGRFLINENDTEISYSNLESRVDTITYSWEKVLVSQILRKMREISVYAPSRDIDPAFKNSYISAWAEMKALLIGLQFNPNSLLTFDEYKDIHTQLQSTVAMTDSSISNFLERMKEISTLLQERFELSDANVGAW